FRSTSLPRNFHKQGHHHQGYYHQPGWVPSGFRSTSLPRNFHKQGHHHQGYYHQPGWVPSGIFHKPHPVVTYTEAGSISQLGEKHLLDDSVLEEQQQQQVIHSHGGRLHSNSESPASRHKHDPDEFGEDMGMQCVLQGCLRRKTVLKEGRKPAVSSWQRYWVQLWATYLVYYPPKSDRSDFKQEPCKMVPVGGWSVFLSDNPFQPDLFQLTDPNRGNVYKYRAGSKASAQQWCRHLQQAACGIKEKPLPANLMSFE
ncbi:hypothetical protein C0J52_18554, partial [Blattella germanica]